MSSISNRRIALVQRMRIHLMTNKSKAVMWLCVTVLAVAGLKYVPPYLIEERKLELQDRALDMHEEAFLQQRIAPTVSVPATAVHENHFKLL